MLAAEDNAPSGLVGARAAARARAAKVRAVRIVDLDRDMSDVIPTGLTPDSEFLFQRMTDLTIDRARPGPGKRILDVASGVGQDSIALASRGAKVVGAEPSQRMTQMARLFSAEKVKGDAVEPDWVQGWADRLPFATGAFDGVVCKGAIDHFDQPQQAIAEMARVCATDGCVVLAIANFESLACRVGRAVDDVRQEFGLPVIRERRGYDAPSDHFTRYELPLMREQAEAHLILESVEGVSVGWGMPGWSKATARLPSAVARAAVQALDGVARLAPVLADVIVLVGRPRRSSSTSR
jgi:SAM-dependent methyltransferase